MTMCAYPSQVREKLITETVPPRTKDERISAACSLSKQLTPCVGHSMTLRSDSKTTFFVKTHDPPLKKRRSVR